MEKRILKYELDVSSIDRAESTQSSEDVGKAMELVQRERDRDVKEKEELRHLNDRFSHFLANIEQLKRINEQLQAQLKDEFAKWGILPRDENELRQIINQINDRAIKRATDEVRSRAAEQETAVLNHAVALYGNIQDIYKRKHDNLRAVIDKLQEELNHIIQREHESDEELSTVRDDLIKELNKFRERLQDWLRLVIDKQTVLDDIQSYRERINLINALNDEEINEWKRLLDQSKDDSMLFYREELTNAIRDIKRDYSKQAKKFQDELEYQIEGQLRIVENQLKKMPGLTDSSTQESDKHRIQMEETKLRASMDEYDKEHYQLNNLTKVLSDKRRLLRDEEAKLHEIERKIRDKQFHERTISEKLKNEYDDLRGRFEQMAYELRFSIEDELRIYSRLLDELMKKSSIVNASANITNKSGENITSTVTRSSGNEDLSTSSILQLTTNNLTAGTSNILDLASSHSGWPQSINLSGSIENLFKMNENEIQETHDDNTLVRSPSFSKLD
ncbi:unnamed protein product [Rotaria magnacalcarata]|uniref:Uncharacterized protein n=1 Tax=Rotaria magnacalcarata TaxID=392030 RepID=A0A814HTX6_9BILA|nr:unnamed protein product [Rotaria magnacalcarata]CAF1346694.1 unnamed protein product [Rotaria magnacalcarata]CAF2009132.1 unnamed protein product [Rotaria magnacalcarata]CAF2134097.1 unnamed protein product [Rotaria magnacalcarata]CAF2149555.1 unnamed protein product [Rotaria magnacalcarata]